MQHYIAMGFQSTVDFELQWNLKTIEELIALYDIHNAEINCNAPIQSERDLLLSLLGFMKKGSGGERFASSSIITRTFAARFSYKITLGGTPVRAAIAMQKLGYRCCLHTCSLNHYFTELIPPTVDWLSSVPDEGEDFHPHVIIQFPQNISIKANDIDFITPRSNRAIFDYDFPSKQMIINENFKNMVGEARVFLAAGYNVMDEKDKLQKRLESTIHIMEHLPSCCKAIYEDGGHEDISLGRFIFQTLSPYLDIFSLNEDELQGYIGHTVDIISPDEVALAILDMYHQAHVPVLICHSAYWTIAYGKNSSSLKKALEGGIYMAATRFRIGDHYTQQDYESTKNIAQRNRSIRFCKDLTSLLGSENIVCIPGLDMDSISHPVTIGLGDAFIGGLLPELLTSEQKLYAQQ